MMWRLINGPFSISLSLSFSLFIYIDISTQEHTDWSIRNAPSCLRHLFFPSRSSRVGAGCYHRVVNFSYSINKQRCAVSYLDFPPATHTKHNTHRRLGIYSRPSAAWPSAFLWISPFGVGGCDEQVPI